MCTKAFEAQTSNTFQSSGAVRNFSQVVNSSTNVGFDDTTNFTFVDLPEYMNPISHANYTVGMMATKAFQSYLQPLFNGNITLDETSTSPSSDAVQAIWNASADLDSWIKNVADSMSNAVRTTTPATSDIYNGTGYQLGIRVRWLWIILPAVLVVSSLMILIAAIIKTERNPVYAWKGSPLVLLFMDVDRDIRKRANGRMDTFNGIAKSVGETRVAMNSDKVGDWVFKAV